MYINVILVIEYRHYITVSLLLDKLSPEIICFTLHDLDRNSKVAPPLLHYIALKIPKVN